MKPRKIAIGNSKIAEFMQIKKIDVHIQNVHTQNVYQKAWQDKSIGLEGASWVMCDKPEWLKYHLSWDLLMPVCQRISSDLSVVIVESNGITDSIWPYIDAMRKMKAGVIRLNFEETYKGVIHFIDWFNKVTQHGTI